MKSWGIHAELIDKKAAPENFYFSVVLLSLHVAILITVGHYISLHWSIAINLQDFSVLGLSVSKSICYNCTFQFKLSLKWVPKISALGSLLLFKLMCKCFLKHFPFLGEDVGHLTKWVCSLKQSTNQKREELKTSLCLTTDFYWFFQNFYAFQSTLYNLRFTDQFLI